nr:MAG TPA: Regulatory protein [Caudoviricetes sp.]
MNTKKLKAAIIERGYNLGQFAEIIEMDRTKLYRRLSRDGATFTIAEVLAIKAKLDLSPAEVVDIFLP